MANKKFNTDIEVDGDITVGGVDSDSVGTGSLVIVNDIAGSLLLIDDLGTSFTGQRPDYDGNTIWDEGNLTDVSQLNNDSNYIQAGGIGVLDEIILDNDNLGEDGIGNGIDFGSCGIYRLQESPDPDSSGLVFYTHPSATSTDPQTLALTINKFGNADFKENLSRDGNTVYDTGNLPNPIQSTNLPNTIVTQTSGALRNGSGNEFNIKQGNFVASGTSSNPNIDLKNHTDNFGAYKVFCWSERFGDLAGYVELLYIRQSNQHDFSVMGQVLQNVGGREWTIDSNGILNTTGGGTRDYVVRIQLIGERA